MIISAKKDHFSQFKSHITPSLRRHIDSNLSHQSLSEAEANHPPFSDNFLL
jgi:hypothetical protein